MSTSVCPRTWKYIPSVPSAFPSDGNRHEIDINLYLQIYPKISLRKALRTQLPRFPLQLILGVCSKPKSTAFRALPFILCLRLSPFFIVFALFS